MVDWSKVRYRAYFENTLGEQWLCWQDSAGIHVAAGQIGWNRVTTYRPEHLLDECLAFPFVLQEDEAQWLSACFTALLEHQGYGNTRDPIVFRPGFAAWTNEAIGWLIGSGLQARSPRRPELAGELMRQARVKMCEHQGCQNPAQYWAYHQLRHTCADHLQRFEPHEMIADAVVLDPEPRRPGRGEQ